MTDDGAGHAKTTGRVQRVIVPAGLVRLMLFGAIGLSGFVPNLACMYALTRAGMHPIAATVLATQVAIVWNFLLLDQVVYRRHRTGAWHRRALKFAAINNLDLPLRVPFVDVLIEFAHLDVLVATVVALVAAFVLRFVATDRLVYRLSQVAGEKNAGGKNTETTTLALPPHLRPALEQP